MRTRPVSMSGKNDRHEGLRRTQPHNRQPRREDDQSDPNDSYRDQGGGLYWQRRLRRGCKNQGKDCNRPHRYCQPASEHERHFVPPAVSSSSTRPRPLGYCGCPARCSASHCSLIQPRGASLAPRSSRILGRMTTAAKPMITATVNNNICDRRVRSFRRIAIVAFPQTCVCSLVHRAALVRADVCVHLETAPSSDDA